jgi:hypothetical protein
MPTRKPKPKADDPKQYRRFVDMAREVEADENPEAMDRAFIKVVSSPRRAVTQDRAKEKKPQ